MSTTATLTPIHLIGHGFLFLEQLAACSVTRRYFGERRLRDFYMREALSFIDQNYQNDIPSRTSPLSAG